MSKLRYPHDFVNMSKPAHRAILQRLLFEYYGRKNGK